MQSQSFADVKVVALVLEGLFDLARNFYLEESLRQRVEVSEVVILVVFLYALTRPDSHEFLQQLLDLPTVFPLTFQPILAHSRHFYFIII